MGPIIRDPYLSHLWIEAVSNGTVTQRAWPICTCHPMAVYRCHTGALILAPWEVVCQHNTMDAHALVLTTHYSLSYCRFLILYLAASFPLPSQVIARSMSAPVSVVVNIDTSPLSASWPSPQVSPRLTCNDPLPPCCSTSSPPTIPFLAFPLVPLQFCSPSWLPMWLQVCLWFPLLLFCFF